MSTLLFVTEISGSTDAGFVAAFPDLPGHKAEASDLAELLVAARTTILAALQALSDRGEAWPQPRSMDQLASVPGVIFTLVDVAVDDPPVRVNISLGEALLQRLDAAAEAKSMTRSGYITHAVRVSLGERQGATGDVDAMGRRLQDELSALGRRLNESLGPESAFTRRMNQLDDFVFDGVRRAADGVSAAMVRRRDAGTGAGFGHPDGASSMADK